MRKFKTRRTHSLSTRLVLIAAGALMLIAAFAPRANAALLRFYDFEGPDTAPYPVGLNSNPPALEQGFTLRLEATTNGVPYPVINTLQEPGLNLNLPGGQLPNLTSLGIKRSSTTNLNIEMPFLSATGIYNVTSVSFAVAANGNGFAMVGLQISTNGGATFANIPGVAAQAIPEGPGSVITFNIPSGTTLNIPLLGLRLNFTGGQSNGNDLQNQIDNIQVNGTAVPEPATIAGGLLGVLGLCWHQRRRLIRCVRLRRA